MNAFCEPLRARRAPLATAITVASLALAGSPALYADGAAINKTVATLKPVTTGDEALLSTPTMVITAVPLSSPVTIVTDPRVPRQPVPASDGADYLKTIPGFATRRTGGTNGDPVFRGMFGSRLRILTNGSEMLGACPNRMDTPTSYINPESYDELTVVKGPQSVLHGPGASAATINFVRGPEQLDEDGMRFDASATVGTYGRFDRRIDTAIGGNTGYLRVIANESEANDYQDGDGDTIHSEWDDRWNADVALGWTPNYDTWLELAVGRGDAEAAYPGRMMDGSRFLRETIDLRFEKRNMSEHWTKLEASLGYAYANHVMDNFRLREPKPMHMGGGHGGMGSGGDVGGTGSGGMDGGDMGGMGSGSMGGGMSGMPMLGGAMGARMGGMGGMGGMSMDDPRMESELDRRTRSGRIASTWEFEDLTWIAGIDGSTEDHRKRRSALDDDGNFLGAGHFAWDKDYTRGQAGIFSELTWYSSDLERWIGGARYDYYRVQDENDEGHSDSAGEVRHDRLPSGFFRYERDLADTPATFYAGLGHVQRFPDFWELKPDNLGPDGDETAFAGVEPEKTTQFDIGLQFQGERLGAWVSGYAGYVQDFILFDYNGGTSGDDTQVTNVDAQIAGAEMGASYDFTENLSGDASLAYAWGRNTEDHEALPQMPPLESRFGLNWHQGDVSVGALWRLVAAQHRTDEGKGNVSGKDFGDSAGFGTLSFNGAYDVNESVTLSAGVDNVFDKTYAEHLNVAGDAGFGFDADERINEPGRMFWTRVDLHF